MKAQKIEISHKTILFVIAILGGIWFLWFIRDVLLQLFVALIVMTILNPFVSKLEKFGIPRVASILLVYFTTIGLVILILIVMVPPLVEESTQLVNKVPILLDNMQWQTQIGERIFSEVISEMGSLPAQVARTTLSIFSNVFDVVTTLIFAFYLLLSRDSIDEQLGALFGSKTQKEIERIIDLLETKLGGWLRGRLLLMLLVGITTYFGLLLLGIPFAVPLAILAGLLEIVPYIGPILSAIPSVIIGSGISLLVGLATAALYIVVQQLEGNILTPKVMEKTVGLSPIITLLAMAIGFKIAGIVGILISVPAVITIHILGREYLSSTT